MHSQLRSSKAAPLRSGFSSPPANKWPCPGLFSATHFGAFFCQWFCCLKCPQAQSTGRRWSVIFCLIEKIHALNKLCSSMSGSAIARGSMVMKQQSFYLRCLCTETHVNQGCVLQLTNCDQRLSGTLPCISARSWVVHYLLIQHSQWRDRTQLSQIMRIQCRLNIYTYYIYKK